MRPIFRILAILLLAFLRSDPAKADNKSIEAEKCFTASLMYLDINRTDLSLSLAEDAVKAAVQINDPRTLAFSYATLGLAHIKNNSDALIGRNKNFTQAIHQMRMAQNPDSYDLFFTDLLDGTLRNEQGVLDQEFVLRSNGSQTITNLFAPQYRKSDSEKLIFLGQFIKHLLPLSARQRQQIIENALNVSRANKEEILIARASANAGLMYAGNPKTHILDSYLHLKDAINLYYNNAGETFLDRVEKVLPCFQSPELRPVELAMKTVRNAVRVDSTISAYSVLPAPNLFASIEVGASGVKLSIVELETSRDGEYEFTIIESGNENTEFAKFTELSHRKTLEAVTIFYRNCIEKYKIADKRIFIAISSGAETAAKETGKTAFLSKLQGDIVKESGAPKEIRVISEQDETKLTLLGVLPRKAREAGTDELYRHLVVDIGTGNTKGGFYKISDKYNDFEYFASTWALGKLLRNTEESQSKGMAEFAKEIQTRVDEAMRTELKEMLNSGGIKNKKDVILTGGIFWAIATVMHPEEAVKSPFIRLTLDDISEFKQLATNDFARLSNPDNYLYRITNLEDRKKAKEELIKVLEKFPQNKCIAGAILAEAMIKENNNTDIPKVYRFAKYGVIGWTTGYIAKALGD